MNEDTNIKICRIHQKPHLQGEFITVNAYIRKEEKSKIDKHSFCLKN